MSLPINIEEVIRGRSVEWERLEFKKGWNPEPVLHTLCAFANDFHNLGGGYIFIGVAQDEGRPVLPPAGLPSHELDHVQKEVLRLGYLIQPAYHPIVEPYVIDGKNILVLRNRRIGEFLKELRLTEGRGTGVPKIIRAMSRNGSPPPRFKTDEERTYFSAILPIHPAATTDKTTPHVTPHVFNVLGEKGRILLAFCRSPRDRASIQSQLGLKDVKHLRQRYLHPLIDNLLLMMTDPKNPASRGQKYKTTELGLAALKHYDEGKTDRREPSADMLWGAVKDEDEGK